MGSFGEDLRRERVSRGVALEQIVAVTKISQRHLVALEEEKFRLLPGGILSKGIVRGYASSLGLNAQHWTERFLEASSSCGLSPDVEEDWTDFAANVGRSRIARRDEIAARLRWIGVLILLIVVAIAGYLSWRYYGLQAGWWPTLLPFHISTSSSCWLQSLFQ